MPGIRLPGRLIVMQPERQMFADRSQMPTNDRIVFTERILRRLVIVAAIIASAGAVRAADVDRPWLEAGVVVHQSNNEAVFTTLPLNTASIADDRVGVITGSADGIGDSFHTHSASDIWSFDNVGFALARSSSTNRAFVAHAAQCGGCMLTGADLTRLLSLQPVETPVFVAGIGSVAQSVAKTSAYNGHPSAVADRQGTNVSGAAGLLANAGRWAAGVVLSLFNGDPVHNPYSRRDIGSLSQKTAINELKPTRLHDGRGIAARDSIANQRAAVAADVDAKRYALMLAGLGAVGFMLRRMF